LKRYNGPTRKVGDINFNPGKYYDKDTLPPP
jgi:hypothetical protein